MGVEMRKAVILGASGPTGKALARELVGRGVAVRVVSRSRERLAQAFADLETEIVEGDLLDADSARAAVRGCDVAFNCFGAPMDRLEQHPVVARHVAAAVAGEGARLVHVSSYWAYAPIRRLPVNEEHPRTGGGLPMRARREAEDIAVAAGGAVLNLPDFYGPEVLLSTLQRALAEVVSGRVANWVGSPKNERDYIYVPDAMHIAAELATREEAYGRRWVVPGSGPASIRWLLGIAGRCLGRQVKVRGTTPIVLKYASVFVPDLRPLRPLLSTYGKPIRFDGSRLFALLGDMPRTPYTEGIPAAVEWLVARVAPAEDLPPGSDL